MDHVLRTAPGRLTLVVALLVAALGSTSARAASMPAIQPIAVQPIGAAPGNGVLTQVTYQVGGSAVNDAGVAAAANEASYVSRAVTMSGSTMGGIVRGGVMGAARFAGWIGLAITAYQVYKWYQDSQTGALTAPGTTTVGASCQKGGSYFTISGNFPSCSAVGAVAQQQAAYLAMFPYITSMVITPCTPAINGDCTAAAVATRNDGAKFNYTYTIHWYQTGLAQNTTDPNYTSQPVAVTDDQLAALANQHPEWWPGMFTDPLTGNVVVNPDIAHDMDALKQQLAPKYGVDPTTLTPTPSDPNYGTQVSTPKQTDLPAYCAWASAACNYYQWVEDHWPDAQKKQYTDSGNCDAPPSCSGDEVMCGVALQAFKTKCSVDSIGGDEPPDAPDHQVQELYGSDVDLGDTSKLDMSGFGLSTACPFTSIDAEFGDQAIHVPLDFICQNGTPLRLLVLIGAAMACAAILGLGGRKVA